MAQSKAMAGVRLVVVTAIGAALYGFGGLIGIPVFANTTLKPAMAILALFAGIYGPVVGFITGFLGHLLTDAFSGWGVWVSWAFGSGLVGAMIGAFPRITKKRISKGEFGGKDAAILIGLSFAANFIGYMISAILDYFFYGEPLDKVITQQLITSVSNTVMIGIIGTILMVLVAKNYRGRQNLTLDSSKKSR